MYSVQHISDAHKCLNIAGPESEYGGFWTQGYIPLTSRDENKKTEMSFHWRDASRQLLYISFHLTSWRMDKIHYAQCLKGEGIKYGRLFLNSIEVLLYIKAKNNQSGLCKSHSSMWFPASSQRGTTALESWCCCSAAFRKMFPYLGNFTFS